MHGATGERGEPNRGVVPHPISARERSRTPGSSLYCFAGCGHTEALSCAQALEANSVVSLLVGPSEVQCAATDA